MRHACLGARVVWVINSDRNNSYTRRRQRTATKAAPLCEDIGPISHSRRWYRIRMFMHADLHMQFGSFCQSANFYA